MKFAALALIACLPAAAFARQTDQKAAHSHALGSVDFKNSGNDAAQPAFQRGVALLHSFEYEDAAEAFREAQKADASLALAYWLEALTYSHVLWAEEKLEASRAVLNRLAPTAEARLAKAKTERERGFGAAVEAFYADAGLPIRAAAFADAMTSLATRFPDDHEAAAFASLANMMAFFTSPAAQRVKYNQPVQQHALRVFRANSQHPGAAHYLIHFVDMNPRAAADALEFARAYDKIAPDAEHALHMPSHVFLPLGLWEDVVRSNERAWAAARRENLAKNASPADNSWHSLDWLHYAYLQLGRDARRACAHRNCQHHPAWCHDPRRQSGCAQHRRLAGLPSGPRDWKVGCVSRRVSDGRRGDEAASPHAARIEHRHFRRVRIGNCVAARAERYGSGTQSHRNVPCRGRFTACGRTAPCCVAPVIHAARRHDRAA